MKKHLQFNDITALSLGWRAARRKAERERKVEREKEQSSSSLLCIFIKENITSFPLLFSFLFLFAFLSHSSTFFSFLSFCLLCSLLPFSSTATDSFPFTTPPFHCVALFIYLAHSVFTYKELFIQQCIFFFFSAVLYSRRYSSQSTGLLEGL